MRITQSGFIVKGFNSYIIFHPHFFKHSLQKSQWGTKLLEKTLLNFFYSDLVSDSFVH